MDAQAGAGHGTTVWSSAAWRGAAVEWADERLADVGLHRTGEVEQLRVRPWATVLRVPTAGVPGGAVWLKATSPGTAFEVGLYELLAASVPDRVLTPLASDTSRGWLLLPDGGPTQGDRLAGAEVLEPFAAAVTEYGALQRRLAPRVDDLLAAGVADMRPAVMAQRLDEALAATAAGAALDAASADVHRRVADLRPQFAAWCDVLAASAVPASLDHNDLHPWNVLEGPDGSQRTRFYDWGDSVVAHPFAALLVPVAVVRDVLGVGVDHPAVHRLRDAYLAGFAPLAPEEDLAATARTACRVAAVARALTWERALRAAREQGDEIDEYWATAPMEHLSALVDPG